MEDYIAKQIVTGVACWLILFLAVKRTFPNRSIDLCSRIVATIHASLAVFLSSLTVQDWTCPACPLASQSSPPQMKVLAFTLSYMIYDLLLTHISIEKVQLDNTVHHMVSIFGIGAGLYYGWSGSEMVASLWITEISTPLLHMRKFLREFHSNGDTYLNLIIDILFAATFSIARMVGGSYLTYMTCIANNPLLIKGMAVCLQLVSAFWFFKIVGMVKHKLTRKKQH